jgi:hypothetical protein
MIATLVLAGGRHYIRDPQAEQFCKHQNGFTVLGHKQALDTSGVPYLPRQVEEHAREDQGT